MRSPMALLAVAFLTLCSQQIQALQSEGNVEATNIVGGPHGKAFDDLSFVNEASGHHRITAITLGPCDDGPVTYLRFDFGVPANKNVPWTSVVHGKLKHGKKTLSIDLKENEYLIKVSLAPLKERVVLHYKTRIGGLTFYTSKNQALSCGTYQEGKTPVDWTTSNERAFLYFSGAEGETIDNLTGHTIPRAEY